MLILKKKKMPKQEIPKMSWTMETIKNQSEEFGKTKAEYIYAKQKKGDKEYFFLVRNKENSRINL
jgi:hypothetical protein